MRARIYARVSTREQLEGYSIDAQLRVCREWIIQQGHSPAGEYIEAASGESIKKRETLREALEDARARVTISLLSTSWTVSRAT